MINLYCKGTKLIENGEWRMKNDESLRDKIKKSTGGRFFV
jgi:hypothetical protein